MKLCVFQGTFNPIHNVHLAMANYVRSHYDFDGILFIPAYKPPHKDIDDELAEHRYNMVKLAIKGENTYHISNIEFQNERFSYTYLTINELYDRYKVNGKISFMIGTDAFYDIDTWYEAKELKYLLDFIVFPREQNLKVERLLALERMGFNYQFANMPPITLSSSIIRSRITSGKPVDTLLPPKVLEYINKHELYRDEK